MAGQPHPERAGLPSPLSLTAASVPSLPPDLATMGKVLSVSTPEAQLASRCLCPCSTGFTCCRGSQGPATHFMLHVL